MSLGVYGEHTQKWEKIDSSSATKSLVNMVVSFNSRIVFCHSTDGGA